MKPSEYWKERTEQIASSQHIKADQYSHTLKKEYEKAMANVQRDIEVFYQRFADENDIVELATARKLLTHGELREFKMTLEEFTASAKDNADGRWTHILNNVYYKSRISRYEAIQIQVRQQVEILLNNQQRGVQSLLSDIYKDTYYRTIFEVQKGIGIGASFAKPDVKSVIEKPWIAENYSQRIWKNRDKLVNELQTNLAQSFIRGDSIDRTTKALAERMGVSYNNAARIVRTESSHIQNQATWDGYKQSGIVKQYEFLATLDGHTSSLCQSMDSRVFKLSEKEIGINFPPLHPNCRSTIVPYFEDDEVGERFARDRGGNIYLVPANMSYEKWKEKYI